MTEFALFCNRPGQAVVIGIVKRFNKKFFKGCNLIQKIVVKEQNEQNSLTIKLILCTANS